MVNRMVLRIEVTKVCCSWGPEDMELFLVHAVLDPVEAHVDGFGSYLFAGAVSNSDCGGIVYLDRCGWLWMAHFVECDAEGYGFFAVVKEGSHFRFCCGRHDIADDLGDGENGSIRRWVGTVWCGTKVEMATYTTACFGLGEVGRVTVDVEYHVAGGESEDGIWVSGAIVQKVGHGVHCCLGSIGLGGGDVVQEMEHCRVHSAGIK